MGMAKTAMMEAEERGWNEIDRWVCANCVEDKFLKQLIVDNAEEFECSYCEGESDEPIAARVSVVQEAVANTIYYYYDAPQNCSVPFEDGSWAISTMNTREVLEDLFFEAHPDLFEELESNFHNSCWVDSADHFWAATRPSQKLPLAWERFVEVVKHQTRYHFLAQHNDPSPDEEELTPGEMLVSIGELLRHFGFIREVPAGTQLFRCRVRGPDDEWKLNEDALGAPPAHLASAGRMNPAGISYLYAAFELGTAVAEVVLRPPTAVAIGVFETERPLLVVDLTKVLPRPSIFDDARRIEYARILFLGKFKRRISRAVQKNGMEHIEYVPSQVVCEYLAQVFRVDSKGTRLDGIIYPSTMKSGYDNIVIFPSLRSLKSRFDGIKFFDAECISMDDWGSLTSAIGRDS